MMKRIIYYYQTFVGLKDILNCDNPVVTHIIVSSIHFGNNTDNSPYIHLNDYEPDNEKFIPLWNELEKASKKGIKIMIMVGGAGGAYGTLFSDFNTYYNMLKKTINNHNYICGIDLDIEENVNLNNVKMIINKLEEDFGKDFIITMAPIASSLTNDFTGMGGFVYKKLFESPEGKRINWFNGQFYGSYSLEIFEDAVNNGYPSDKIVMGMLSGNYDEDNFENALVEINKISKKYSNFGGVFTWEYLDCPPNKLNHYDWAKLMHSAMNNTNNNSYSCNIL